MTQGQCSVEASIQTSSEIAVRQSFPGSPDVIPCSYSIKEIDWKPAENAAYNMSASLEIVAKVTYTRR